MKNSLSTEHDSKYRPDIDGLRALAVVAVVLYHCWPLWFVSGFIGVDIFFVISGYLITGILLNQLEQGKFSILDFYSRRVRRIFPALLVVLLATLAFSWFILLQDEFALVGKHIAAGGGFVSNLVLWAESGYFDHAANTKPLLHLWSLGVEEQFYFLWPIILWTVFHRRINFLLVTAVIFVISMAANVLLVQSNPTAAFYSPLTRFWELMVGGVGAYLHLHHAAWSARQRKAGSIAGALLLLAGFAFIKPQGVFPGWWALLPVAGTFLLIMAGPAAFINRRLLGNKVASGIGLISYPLYLWHWPLLSFAFIIYGEKPSYQLKVALMAGAVVLAYLTYRLVEIPLRRQASRHRVRVVSGLVAGMAAMALVGIGVQAGVVRERINVHGSDAYLAALNDFDFPGKTFVPYRYNGLVFQKLNGQAPGLTVFIGDSLVQQYGPRIEQQLGKDPARYNSVIFATGGGCPPIIHTIRLPLIRFPLCPKTMETAFDLAARPEVSTVVIGAAWYVHFANWNNEIQYDTGSKRLPFPSGEAHELAYASFKSTLQSLHDKGKRVYLIMQPPGGEPFDPRNMYEGSRFGAIYPREKIDPFSLDKFNRANAAPRERLLAIAQATGTLVIEPGKFLCREGLCPVLNSAGVPNYTDPLHMRPEYTRHMVTYLDQTMVPAVTVSQR